MRMLGVCFVLAAGYLCSVQWMEPSRRHLIFLEDGEYFIRLMESKTGEEKVPLPELFAFLCRVAKEPWLFVFTDIKNALEKGEDVLPEVLWEQVLRQRLGGLLQEKELGFFIQAGRGLFSSDRHFQAHRVTLACQRLAEHIDVLRDNLTKKQKACRALCLSMSILVILILI